jgi:hypothetical protein
MVVLCMATWEYSTSMVEICTSGHARQSPRFRFVIFLILAALFTIEG